MSDLQRSFAKAKLASYPAAPPTPFDEAEEEEETDAFTELPVDDDSSSASSASSASSTGTIIPSSNQNLFARPHGFVDCFHFLNMPRLIDFTSVEPPINELSTRYLGQLTSSASCSSNQRQILLQLPTMHT